MYMENKGEIKLKMVRCITYIVLIKIIITMKLDLFFIMSVFLFLKSFIGCELY